MGIRNTRSRFIEHQNEEYFNETDREVENEQTIESGDGVSQFSDQHDDRSVSALASELVYPPSAKKRSRKSPRTTSRMSDSTSARRSSRRNAAKKYTSYEEVGSDTEHSLINTEEDCSPKDSYGRKSAEQAEGSLGRRPSRENASKKCASDEEFGTSVKYHSSNPEDSESTEDNHTGNPRRKLRVSEPTEQSLGRRSSRRNAAKKFDSYEEFGSDVEYHLCNSEDFKTTEENRGRKSCRKRRCVAPSYTELESDVDERKEGKLPPPKRTATKRKRQAGRSTKSATIKKTKGRSTEFPNLQKWPKIKVGDITKVIREILKRLSEDDELRIFSKPVIEAYPDIADSYLKMIETPMDLQTISEERANVYSSISMLQDDLVIMFRNCCTFNGKDSDWGKIAITQWEDINRKFDDVCNDLDIPLPRRWRP
jgi:hypothetical protein